MEKILETFTIDKEEYNVIESKLISYIDNHEFINLRIKTPNNCFGYSDTIALYKNYNYDLKKVEFYALALHRKHNKKVMRICESKLLKHSHKLGLIIDYK